MPVDDDDVLDLDLVTVGSGRPSRDVGSIPTPSIARSDVDEHRARRVLRRAGQVDGAARSRHVDDEPLLDVLAAAVADLVDARPAGR